MSATEGPTGGHKPDGPDDENGAERFLSRFASEEARQVIRVSRWFLVAAVVAVGIEIVVAYLEQFPKLYFVTVVLDLLGKLILSCDAVLIAVYVVVATMLALHSVLKLIHIDLVAFTKWVGRWVAKMFTRKGEGGVSPVIGNGGGPVIDHDPQAPAAAVDAGALPGDGASEPLSGGASIGR